ncbi:hypothetical protein Scep_009633 [Stephania cephalantha]|uniref:Ribosomal protein S13 n=1 Tax=Stephania cephalantha TaxID=152367 RepID=A0AAP0JW03_9MAGN
MAQTLAMRLIYNGANLTNLLQRTHHLGIPNQSVFRGLGIKFFRVSGVEIANDKRIGYSLQYIHGVGRSRARQILSDLDVDNKITKDLSAYELVTIRDEWTIVFWVLLRRFNAQAIRKLEAIQCYRGVRHIEGLPCRGQSTKNNCRTLKGKRVAIAGEKAPR